MRSTRLSQALIAALLITFTPLPAMAATIAVSSPDDTDPSAVTTCTLRQAIVSMNAGMLQGNCSNALPGDAFGSNDTISFAPSIVTGATIPGTIMLADSADNTGSLGGTLLITAANLTLDASEWRGSGAGQYAGGVTIMRPPTATNSFGIIRDSAPAGSLLTLKGLSLRHGKAASPLCETQDFFLSAGGGGICIPSANLTLIRSTINGNSAEESGGGISSNTGNVTLHDSIVSGNSARLGGGIFSQAGDVNVGDSTITENLAASAGGGIRSKGTLTVSNSTISHNLANGGGGISIDGNLTLINSTVSSNQAFNAVGGISAGARADRTTVLLHSTVSNNTGRQFFGGVQIGAGSLTINNSILSGNIQPTGSENSLVAGWTGANNRISVPAADLNLRPLQHNGGLTQTMLPGPGSTAIDAVPEGFCNLATDQRGVARAQSELCDIGAVEVRRVQDSSPSQCSGGRNGSETFFDNFPGSSLDPSRWTQPTNSGTIVVANNGVALSGSPFPYVTAVGSPIPARGEFSVRWVAAYGSQQFAGTSSLALTQTLPMIGDTSTTAVARAWQDAGDYRVEVQNSASTQTIAYSVLNPTPVRHDIEYCWLSDIADITEVYVDGTLQLRQARDPSVPRPTTLWFGNPSNAADPSWQPFTLYYVDVRALNDVIFRNDFGML